MKIITPSVVPKETPDPVAEPPKVSSDEKKKVPLYKSGPLSKLKYKYKRKGLYLKIYGGANVLNGGDFRHLIKTNELNNEDLSETNKSPFYKGFGGELGYDFGKVAVAVEVGSISKRFNARVDDNIFHGHWDRTFSALPVLLNLYLKVMDYSFVNASLFGGGGIYFGKYSEKWKWEYKSYENSFQTGFEKSTGKRIGFHLGGSVEFNITKKLLFFLQTRFRVVSFKNIYGKGEYSIDHLGVTRVYEGDLYYIISTESALSGFYIGSDYNRYAASGEKATLKMNGLTLTVGIKFNFQ